LLLADFVDRLLQDVLAPDRVEAFLALGVRIGIVRLRAGHLFLILSESNGLYSCSMRGLFQEMLDPVVVDFLAKGREPITTVLGVHQSIADIYAGRRPDWHSAT
jgi:hypothetical protein